MFFSRFTPSTFDIIPKRDELKDMMTNKDAANKLKYKKASAPRESLVQEAESMDALKKALEDHKGDVCDTVNENLKLEMKKFSSKMTKPKLRNIRLKSL